MSRISFASDLDFLKTNGEDRQATFFELESSSPPARLDPGDCIRHVHRTCHFEGQFDALNDLSMKVLGTDLNELL